MCLPARSAPATPAFFGLLAAFATTYTLGCAIPTRVAELDLQIPRTATPVAIQAGIDTMDDPATERRVQHMLASPEMKAVQRELVAGLVDGTLATLDEKERSGRIEALATKAMTGLLMGAERDVAPMAKEVTRNAVNGALEGAMEPRHRRALESSVDVLVTTSVRSAAQGLKDAELGKTMSAAMTEELGPAFRKSMRDDVAPSLAEMLKNEDFRRELGETARVLGREMVLGATDALASQKEPPKDGTLLSRVSSMAQNGAKLFGSASWVLVLVIVALVAWIVRLALQMRRYATTPVRSRPRRAVTLKLTARRRAGRFYKSATP